MALDPSLATDQEAGGISCARFAMLGGSLRDHDLSGSLIGPGRLGPRVRKVLAYHVQETVSLEPCPHPAMACDLPRGRRSGRGVHRLPMSGSVAPSTTVGEHPLPQAVRAPGTPAVLSAAKLLSQRGQ